jgi:hypothetical protein
MFKTNNYLKELKKGFENLLDSFFMTFEEVKKLKKVNGVYLIYFDKKIIYVGSTNNFNVRFGTDLLHGSTHTLHKKLLNEGKTVQEIKDFFKNKCKYKIKICENMLKAEALEHFTIWVEKPKYNKHIYKCKK